MRPTRTDNRHFWRIIYMTTTAAVVVLIWKGPSLGLASFMGVILVAALARTLGIVPKWPESS